MLYEVITRIKVLSDLYQSEKQVPAVIEFVDIAGLVKGASKGEGLRITSYNVCYTKLLRHRAGDFASRFCVEEFARRVSESDEMTVVGTIERALRETNEQLIIQAKEHTELDGMGTTFVMAVINGDDMIVANIGDSRLYRMDQDLHQITEDHSLVAEMVRNGDIEREEARFHPNKNIVTRALSTTGIVLPDFFEIRLHAEDIVLLCSDGLFTMLEDSEIEDIINCNRDNLEKAGKELVEKANAGGGKDNISLILVKKDGR